MKLSGQTILIADDNIDDRFFVGRALNRLASGLSVQFVASGQQAVAYLNGAGLYGDRLMFPYPSFVITDCEMPDGDGFSVLRRLQAKPSRSARVMMLSSSENPKHSRRAYGLGANSYSLKTGDPKALVSIVSQFLDLPAGESVDRSGPMRLA